MTYTEIGICRFSRLAGSFQCSMRANFSEISEKFLKKAKHLYVVLKFTNKMRRKFQVNCIRLHVCCALTLFCLSLDFCTSRINSLNNIKILIFMNMVVVTSALVLFLDTGMNMASCKQPQYQIPAIRYKGQTTFRWVIIQYSDFLKSL